MTVVDAATGAEICDAHVIIAGPERQEIRTSCPYSGGTGGGKYDVTVEKTGYGTGSRAVDVPTSVNACEGTQHITVSLVRAPAT